MSMGEATNQRPAPPWLAYTICEIPQVEEEPILNSGCFVNEHTRGACLHGWAPRMAQSTPRLAATYFVSSFDQVRLSSRGEAPFVAQSS